MTQHARTLVPRILASAALLALAACAGGSPPPTGPAPAPEPAGAEQIGAEPEVTEPPADSDKGILGDAEYDLPVKANRWVETELKFLTEERRAVIGRWLERADPYEGWVREIFASYGIPRDLHHLAMVESGYVPTARSRAGAVGMWQFMPATGRGMGLRVDELVDERMDPVRSTHAAARHLKELHGRFGGDWELAAAAYNAGSGRIGRGLQRFGVDNFWDLATQGDLATETKHYVPRLYAVTIVGRDRARFGYPLPEGVRPFAYDSVQVDVEIPLAELARLGGLAEPDVTALNPHLVKGIAPADYWVWTPDGTGPATQVAFQESDFRRDGGMARYAVRRGDHYGRLAELTGVSVARIRALNPGVNPSRLRTGQRLVLPAAAVRALDARPAERVASRPETAEDRPASAGPAASAPAERASRRAARSTSSADADRPERSSRRAAGREHTVEPGETLWSISRKYDVSVDDLKAANEIEGSGIRAGQTLRVPGASGGSGGQARAAAREHTVEAGETLWGIARQYDTTVDAVRAANGLGERDTIRPGQTLKLPAAPR